MEHYFIAKQHKDSDYFTFTETFNGKQFTFKSVDSVFSKDKIDEGTKVLLSTIIKNNIPLNGDVLDFGCGLGVIGIVLKTFYNNINVDMLDVNSVAVELSKQNCKLNNVPQNNVFESDLYNNVDKKYNHIVTNPPIKVGKQILFGVVSGAADHLVKGGTITLVIRKSHGEESMKKHMETVFGNATILKRDKGYYILQSTKN